MDILPASITELHELFKAKGKKLYVVGGAVRDFLSNKKPKDFDLATDAMPDEVMEVIRGRFRHKAVGEAFGVVVVYTEDQPEGMEIATFRQDVSKGRNPQVKLGVGIEDDVKRRDLTYNALFYDLDTQSIVDLVGGINDLNTKTVRTVGDPYERFEEDALRILRTFRFCARYGHELDEKTAEAIRNRPALSNIDPDSNTDKRISSERIWEEIKKTWKQAPSPKDFVRYLKMLSEFNMWPHMFPGLDINPNILDSDDFYVLMAGLLRDEPSKRLAQRLVGQPYTIESETAQIIEFLVSLQQFKIDEISMYLKLRDQQYKVPLDTIRKWYIATDTYDDVAKAFIEYKPTVTSDQVISDGFKGKEIGIEMARREADNFRRSIK